MLVPFNSTDPLIERNNLLELVIENIPAGLIVLDEQLRVVASNSRLRELLQLPRELFAQARLTLHTVARYLAERGDYGPGNVEDLVAQRIALAQSGTSFRRERNAPGGRLLELRVTYLDNGWVVQTYQDVTEERAAEARLRASEERLEVALQASGLGLWEFTPGDDRVYLSASWQQIMGFPARARTVSSRELLPLAVDEASAAAMRAGLVDLLKGRIAQLCFEHEGIRANGTRVWFQTEAQVAGRDLDGRALRVVGTTKNIAERKREEKALKAAAEAAESASRAKAEFLATMSHEIRTPLNGVIGLSRVLEQSALPEREAGYVRLINSCANSLLGMVNDVLDFSKIEAGQMVLEPSECDLHALVRETGDVFADRARSKGIDFAVELAPEVPRWVTLDANRLRQILMNLLGNAMKFTAAGSCSLRVGTGMLARQRSLQFAVTDTGIGIPPEDQAKLFKRFSQVDASSTRRFQGSGLGLAISRDLAQLMGGDIRLSSATGAGSTFTLEIPLVEAAAAAPQAADTAAAASTRALLLVEDNPINQLVAQALLEKLGYSDVTVAEHGEEALRLAQERAFDLVLMDCQMPVMDGFEATRRMREQGMHMPIVALTAGAVSNDRERCLESGMNDYVAKPIDAGLLGGVLSFWLASTSFGTRGG
ncbi:ATP-binding protein [Ramlibacter rhizophilus]|nr:ATP-binding protein [Ramlibacter rhizophilus]